MSAVDLITNTEALERQKELFDSLRDKQDQQVDVLAFYGHQLLGDAAQQDHIRRWLERGNRMRLLTMAAGGLGARLEAQLSQRTDGQRRLRQSREEQLRFRASLDQPQRLEMRQLDWLPPCSMFLHRAGEGLQRGLVGATTPDLSLSSSEKWWTDLPAEHPALRSHGQQYEAIWQKARPLRGGPIFLSYSSRDEEIADHVELILRRSRLEVFRDSAHRRSGVQAIDELLRSALDGCGGLLVLWSNDWEASLWCRQELEHLLRKPENERPLIDVLKIRDTHNEAPHFDLRGHLYREGVDRHRRELELLDLAERRWSW
jgi:TIR domain